MQVQVLVLQLGGQPYALETRQVIRILPAVQLTILPRAPAFIAGVLNYHGTPVPVLDLARLMSGAHASSDATRNVPDDLFFDTRLLLVEHAWGTAGARLLGLWAEHVTGVRHIDQASVRASGVHDPRSPFLGQVVSSEQPMLQMIGLAELLPADVAAWLFDAGGAVAC